MISAELLSHLCYENQSYRWKCSECFYCLVEGPWSLFIFKIINRELSGLFIFLGHWCHLLVAAFWHLSLWALTVGTKKQIWRQVRNTSVTVNCRWQIYKVCHSLRMCWLEIEGWWWGLKRFPTNLLQRSKDHLCDVLSPSTKQPKS